MITTMTEIPMDQPPIVRPAPPPLQAPPVTSGLAIASLITALTCFAPAAIICGHMALSRIKKSGGQLQGYGLALAGLIIGYITIPLIILQLISILFVGARAWKRGSDRAACLMNQRAIVSQLSNYCAQHDLKPGDPIQLDEALSSETKSNCPSGGQLQIADTMPEPGEDYVTCPHDWDFGHNLDSLPESNP